MDEEPKCKDGNYSHVFESKNYLKGRFKTLVCTICGWEDPCGIPDEILKILKEREDAQST